MGQIVKQKRGDGWMDYHRLLHLTSVLHAHAHAHAYTKMQTLKKKKD